jgi:methionyl-tRNA synthetase
MKILITSALPYANGPLHFGHIAGAYLPGDCYARFQRLQADNEVAYICASDEFGLPITLSAEQAGRTPQEQVDLFHHINKELFKTLQISFNHYSRTTWPGHVATTQQYFTDLLNNGYIEAKETLQLYSEAEKRFLADRYVVGTCPKCHFENARGDECPRCGASYEATDLKNPRSKMSGTPLTSKMTKHWFLKLDLFKDRLLEWLESKQWKPNVMNFIKGFIRDLHPRAITRDTTWGVPIPLPDTEGKVLYVWFDAPIGYISATIDWAQQQGDPERWKAFWCDPATRLVNFIGKDNIPFHAAIFPAMTMGQNQPFKLVDELPANEFYNLEGRQFSKSDGWYIDLEEFFTRYSSDQIRYVIAANAPENSDSEFSWKDFQQRCNSELLGKYGNLVNRVLVFAKNHCDGTAPERGPLEAVDETFLATIYSLVDEAHNCYSHFKLRRASQIVMELAQTANGYFDSKHPWKDAKNADTRNRMATTIACCLEAIQLLGLISYPIIPTTANAVWELIGYKQPLGSRTWQEIVASPLAAKQLLPPPSILFQRIEDSQIAEELEKLNQRALLTQGTPQMDIETNSQTTDVALTATDSVAVPAAPNYDPLKPEISIDEIDKIDLRVALIEHAERVPKSKKLLLLKVDMGFEKRTIVSGISLHYTPEQLIGKKVVVVANLKPATLMGVESHGMLLAGSLDTALEVISPVALPPGAVVR